MYQQCATSYDFGRGLVFEMECEYPGRYVRIRRDRPPWSGECNRRRRIFQGNHRDLLTDPLHVDRLHDFEKPAQIREHIRYDQHVGGSVGFGYDPGVVAGGGYCAFDNALGGGCQ